MKIKILALVVMLGIFGRVDATYFVSAGDVLSACESGVGRSRFSAGDTNARSRRFANE